MRRDDGSTAAEAAPARVLVVGDLHAISCDAERVVRRAVNEHCRLMLQLGDLTYRPHTPAGRWFLDELHRLLDSTGTSLWFVDGNHDDHDTLAAISRGERDPVELTRRLMYLPRGARWTWRGVRFRAVGGAAGIDLAVRLASEAEPGGTTMAGWPGELIHPDDVSAAIRGGPTDVLVAHDIPAGTQPPAFEFWRDPLSRANRVKLRRIVDATRPTLVLHGHYHHRHDTMLELEVGHRVRVLGLADASQPPASSCYVLDLDQLAGCRAARV